MGEVDDVKDSVNQRQSKCHQRIDGTKHQAVDQGRDQNDRLEHQKTDSCLRLEPEAGGRLLGWAWKNGFCRSKLIRVDHLGIHFSSDFLGLDRNRPGSHVLTVDHLRRTIGHQ